MILFGKVKPKIKDGYLNNITCPYCEQQTTMKYSIFGKYVHIWWVPIFPYGKTNILECNSCKTTYNLKELPERIKHKFELVKHKGFPLWYFSGLILMVLAISYFSYSESKHKDVELEYLSAPNIGDIYSILSETKGQFTTMKVIGVTNDSVHVVYNDYEIDNQSAIYRIDKEDNYTVYQASYSKKEIVSLYNEKTIYNIDRD